MTPGKKPSTQPCREVIERTPVRPQPLENSAKTERGPLRIDAAGQARHEPVRVGKEAIHRSTECSAAAQLRSAGDEPAVERCA
jgi:hypothetical protein